MKQWGNETQNLTVLHADDTGFVSHKVIEMFSLLNYVILGSCIVIFGITTNIINIIVFLKAGIC